MRRNAHVQAILHIVDHIPSTCHVVGFRLGFTGVPMTQDATTLIQGFDWARIASRLQQLPSLEIVVVRVLKLGPISNPLMRTAGSILENVVLAVFTEFRSSTCEQSL